MKFAHFFVDRPIFASVLSIVFVILGLVAYAGLPVAQYPEIAPPTIVVRASYPGANAETVAATVATPLEQEINGVEDMLYMSSYSTGDGSMSLTITFKLGTNLDQANVLVQNRVASATPRLPDEVRRLGVTTRKSSPDLMMVVHMLSPDDSYDQLYISNYASIRIRDQLLRLDGIGDIQLFGAREYSIRVWLDPNRLAAYQLTAADIVRALQEQNIQVSGGALGQQPAPTDAAFQLTVQTQGRFEDVRQFRQVIVKSSDGGRLVRVGDVARVELGARDYVTNSYLNGKPAVALAIFQRPGSNALAAAEGIIKKMNELKRDFPSGIDYQIVYNPTEFVAESVREVYKTLFEALILVVIVVIVFLQSWRTAIIPIVAIPVSLIGTFAMMSAFGFSLNTLTLFGLVLAIGIVVDDAIVVVENVERVMEEHPELSPAEATKRAMAEITAPIIAITLVLLSVFVPVAFIPGISGELFRQFAVTVAVAMFLSAINALTLSPALCSVLLRPHHGPRPGPIGYVMRGIDHVRDRYGAAVARIVRFSVIGLVLVAVAGFGIVGLAKITPTGFLPEDDQGALFVVVQLPGGASVGRTSEVIRRAEAIVKDEKAVEDYISVIGLNFIDNYSQSNAAFMVLTLKPFEHRKDPGLGARDVMARLGAKFRQIEGGTVVPLAPPPILGLGTGGGFTYVLEDLRGGDPKELAQVLRGLTVAANQNPQLSRVFSTFSAT
ncbi:MAG: efflux RND transporter permease subunit, partial [Microvirga sp.]